MFLLDSLMISGLKWVMNTVVTAAEAEMNDDTALREQLLDAEMRREMGEITDDEFVDIEADILARIREIKERRDGGSGPLSMSGAEPIETSEDSRFQVEASVSGDFHDPAEALHTTIIESEPVGHALAHLVETHSGEQIAVLDMEPGDANPTPRTKRTSRTARTKPTTRTRRTKRAARTTGHRKIRS